MSRRLLWLSIPFKEPFTTAAGAVKARDIVVLRVQRGHVVGYGEAAPFEPYDGVAIADVARVLQEQRFPTPYPQVHAADEMAFLDLEGRRLGTPVAELASATVPVNFTLAGATPEDVAASASAARREGYDCFKLKVGFADDEARVAAVRDAIGADALLRLDANGAWAPDDAVKRIRRLAPYGLQLVEQPCVTLEDLAAVRRACEVPIAADESVQGADDVRAAARLEACDMVSIKLAPMGGVNAARAAIEAARSAGIAPYLSSALDGPWGIAAALQLASAEEISLHCGLATLDLFDAAIARALPSPKEGKIEVPAGPGLGVDVSDEAIREVLVQEL
ncbi:MAG TPA: enolase C-terminal domain-like protein [Thermoleophilaceae bacterium]|nr:enolase C-terminal domain-like protein [Thermoleophilaceae bacterium]